VHGFSKAVIESAEVMAVRFNKRIIPALCSIVTMVILILDSKTALAGVAEGMDLCLKVVIPSLFPFLILSTVLTESTSGMSLRFLGPLCRFCRIPDGAAPLLLVGLIGGYPVGARCVTQAWQNGQLTANDARRMLGFCSNAGPAFIFGMTAGLFRSPLVPWVLWMVQIGAILVTGHLLPGGTSNTMVSRQHRSISPSAALHQAVIAMASICGWVIVFRTAITFCDIWILTFLPSTGQCLAAGILELTNGCCRLSSISSESLRFLLCSVFLSSGGIGVYMQTLSVTQELGTGSYLCGKLLQTGIAAMLALEICPALFPADPTRFPAQILLPAAATGALLAKILKNKKNNSRNPAAQGV
jgi:hypothetical protein